MSRSACVPSLSVDRKPERGEEAESHPYGSLIGLAYSLTEPEVQAVFTNGALLTVSSQAWVPRSDGD